MDRPEVGRVVTWSVTRRVALAGQEPADRGDGEVTGGSLAAFRAGGYGNPQHKR